MKDSEKCDGCEFRFLCYTARGYSCLKDISTRQLMAWRNRTYKTGDKGFLDELKTELATREHIPNKQEAKKIRQLKAKTRK